MPAEAGGDPESRPHFTEDRLVVGRDVVVALDEEERDELERGEQCLDARPHVAPPALAGAAGRRRR